MNLSLDEIYAHDYWNKRTWITKISKIKAYRTHETLDMIHELGLVSPGVFMGIADEGEVARFEWIAENDHTVLGLLFDGTYEIFHISFNRDPLKNHTSHSFFICDLNEAMLALGEFLIDFKPYEKLSKEKA